MPEVFAKVNFSQFPFRFWSFFCNLIAVINFSHLNSEYKTKTLQKVNKLFLKKRYKTPSIQTNFDLRYWDYNHTKEYKLT